MKILITGATGMIGSNFLDYIYENNKECEIYATKKPRTKAYRPEIAQYFDCDICDVIAVINIIKEVKPDKIFLFAAQSYPKVSESNPQLTIETNINGTFNFLEAIRMENINSGYMPKKVILISSSSVYGDVNGKYPTDEDTQFHPLSLYAVTKATSELLGYQYFKNYDLPIVIVRPYIILGVRQGNNSSVNSFAEQIAKIEKNGSSGVIKVGNLSTSRDFLDSKDLVKAVYLLSDKGVNGQAYNVCSNNPRLLKDVLDDLISMSKADIAIEVDPDKLRPSDIPLECGNYTKLFTETGWTPTRKWKSETLKEILNYWREQQYEKM